MPQDYKVDIIITNARGEELLDKRFNIKGLEKILDLDLSLVYAESQQNEINDGLDIPDTDEFTEN